MGKFCLIHCHSETYRTIISARKICTTGLYVCVDNEKAMGIILPVKIVCLRDKIFLKRNVGEFCGSQNSVHFTVLQLTLRQTAYIKNLNVVLSCIQLLSENKRSENLTESKSLKRLIILSYIFCHFLDL